MLQEDNINLRKLYGFSEEDGILYHDNLNQALMIIQGWLKRNVGGADHMKALKM